MTALALDLDKRHLDFWIFFDFFFNYIKRVAKSFCRDPLVVGPLPTSKFPAISPRLYGVPSEWVGVMIGDVACFLLLYVCRSE